MTADILKACPCGRGDREHCPQHRDGAAARYLLLLLSCGDVRWAAEQALPRDGVKYCRACRDHMTVVHTLTVEVPA